MQPVNPFLIATIPATMRVLALQLALKDLAPRKVSLAVARDFRSLLTPLLAGPDAMTAAAADAGPCTREFD
jgi:hypothetical protein